ncbi:ATP-dependent DNA helicase [Granulosicoccaceae sp. 1_MG-2023]|nr:ATP-dependent DNA helicase [Granulosicoccaceae sp. 1_MG-2023]
MFDKYDSIEAVFARNGPLAQHLNGFAPRQEQLRLSEAVASCIENQAVLLGEAGTGIGKTFAYLVPAVMSGKKVLISTGTKHLQDQLYKNDLPIIRRALAPTLQASLLKGRANYLCLHRLERALSNPALRSPERQRELALITAWSRRTDTGDIAEVLDVPEDSPVWNYVVSQDDFCSKHEFEELAGCFVSGARKAAQEADIVVVNHHLLCADLALKEEGFGELLPTADALIIDEAHQLPEVAAGFFGGRISSRQLLDLSRDVIGEQMHEAPDMRELRDGADELETAVRNFRLAFGVDTRRDAWAEVRDEEAVVREMAVLEGALTEVLDLLDSAKGRGKGLDACRRRCVQLRESLRQFRDMSEQKTCIYWFETFRTGFMLNMTPMNVAGPFQRVMEVLPAAWVFTSATLTVGGDFSHFRHRLGIKDGEELLLDSPFNYRDNALLYLPPGLPEPRSNNYTEGVMKAMLPVLEASDGRAFILFTSYRAMEEARYFLERRTDYNLLVQQQMPKRELVEAFQSLDRAVLLGTSSFWEGVDVRGEALSLVIIEKLPFASPGDPVMSARIRNMREDGGDPFIEFQLPQAAIALKQGAGRLIRGVSDTGVLVLCDPRVQTKHYGELFINSLPAMPITREIEEVQCFFEALASRKNRTEADSGAQD